MRASGVSALQMLWPALKVGIVVSGITAFLTLYWLPRGNWDLRMLRAEIGIAPVLTEIKPRVFHEQLPGIVLYVEDIDPVSKVWKGIFLADSTEKGDRRLVLARQGYSIVDEDLRRLQLHFEKGTSYITAKESPEEAVVTNFGSLDVPVDVGSENAGSRKEKRGKDKTVTELWRDIRQGTPFEHHASLVELHRRMALPFSPLIFAVLAVTLGIKTPKGGRGHGFAISVVVAFTYYVLFATGSTLSEGGALPIVVGVWGANLVTGLAALISLRRANVESPLLRVPSVKISLGRLSEVASAWSGRFKEFGNHLTQKLPRLRLRVARVVDLYMLRMFCFYFLMTLLVCLALVCLFTFFELVDDVVKNEIASTTVLNYFFFLQPHFLMLLVPISILIATLVTFGLLEKSNQIIAMKACGISVYRLAIPIFLLSVAISGFVFLMQEHVLPFANQRQDGLRKIIKGSPAQTYQPGRNWIFGEEDVLFNYNHFSPTSNQFAEFSMYKLDIGNSILYGHLYAQHAAWDRETQRWRVTNGTERDFTAASFEPFEERLVTFNETPEYFDEEVKASSKLTYAELKEHIADLQTGGFEVEYLQTELYKKLSFPLVNLIMAVIGLPFALTMGRKGALYGIAAGVMIGIVYWGAFGVFDVFGSSGLLAPFLAAWGPNILFGTGGVILLSMIRT
jgi:LPS export ABC transporter permease LptG